MPQIDKVIHGSAYGVISAAYHAVYVQIEILKAGIYQVAVVVLDDLEVLHVHAAEDDGGVALAAVIVEVALHVRYAELRAQPVAALEELLLHPLAERIEEGVDKIIELPCKYAVDGLLRLGHVRWLLSELSRGLVDGVTGLAHGFPYFFPGFF